MKKLFSLLLSLPVAALLHAADKRPNMKELRGALDNCIEDTHDLGVVPEPELIKRGLVRDILSTYAGRKQVEKQA